MPHRRGDPADHARDHLRAAAPRRADRLRVRPERQPDAPCARILSRVARECRARVRVRERDVGGGLRAARARRIRWSCGVAERHLRRDVPAHQPGVRAGRRHVERRRLQRSRRARRRWPDGTTVVWIETPTNPTLSIIDIAAVADDRPSTRRAGRRRQHVCDAVSPTTARARSRRRRALGHEVPRWSLRRGGRVRGHQRPELAEAWRSCRTQSARCRARPTASSCFEGSRRSACAWTVTA